MHYIVGTKTLNENKVDHSIDYYCNFTIRHGMKTYYFIRFWYNKYGKVAKNISSLDVSISDENMLE